MSLLFRIIVDLIIVLTIFGVVFFLYQNYSPVMINYLYGEQKITVFLRDVPLIVTPVDTPQERQKGLSGVSTLADNEGMLFIFESEGRYGFWMKDTLLSLDIIWANNNMEIVHIEKNVRPESYPATYYPPVPARFVIETNAFFVSTFNINVGDKVTIPEHRVPLDLR